MEAYTSFAEVYDMFQDNIPYEEWTAYLSELLADYDVEEGLVLDLGCGTGTVTELLAARGYDMIGVDHSDEMLGIAMQKKAQRRVEREEAGEETGEETAQGDRRDSILYLCQDMREFELYGTVAAAVSICDSMNYITDLEDLTEVFRLVNNYLDPGGVFIFDMNTPYKYETLLADNTFAEVRDESSFIWENFYDEEERINEYDLTLFIREKDEVYRRYTETHFQRAFALEEVQAAAEKAGLQWVAAYDAFTREPVRPDSERIYIVVREQGKVPADR